MTAHGPIRRSTKYLFRKEDVLQKSILLCRHKSYTVKDQIALALNEFEDIKLKPLRIRNCTLGDRFSTTRIAYDQVTTTHPTRGQVGVRLSFRSMYQRGFECLRKYVNGETNECSSNGDPRLQNMDYSFAISALCRFLTDRESHERCLKDPVYNLDVFEEKAESEVAALFMSHLLSHLIFGNRYYISNNYANKPSKCPCLETKICTDLRTYDIIYGQTNLGCREIWHGDTDVVLTPVRSAMIPVSLCLNEKSPKSVDLDESEGKEPWNESAQYDTIETESSEHYDYQLCVQKVLSQAITFSFYQSNFQKRESVLGPTLIPFLALTPEDYYIVMYDHEHDILLSSCHQPTSLWDKNGEKFNLSVILQIWMILNHSAFIPEVTPLCMKLFANTCNFHNILKDLNLFNKTKEISFKRSFYETSPQSVDIDEEDYDLLATKLQRI